MQCHKFLSLGLMLIVSAMPASAIDPPSKKPSPPYKSSVLNRSDAERVQLALSAASSGDWDTVRALRQAINDPAAKKLLLWRETTSSLSATDFATLNRALNDLDGWPGLYNLRIAAEEAISSSSLSTNERIEWLVSYGPTSGEGKLALADAYMQVGRRAEAETLIKEAWHEHSFLISRQREIANKYAEILDPADHVKRVDYLLWTSQRSAADAMKPYLSDAYDRLIDARIALAVGANGVDGKINAVPASLQNDPGLLYERSYWRRKRGRWEDARPLLLELNPDGLGDRALSRIWDEKNLHIRRAIRDDEYTITYQLAESHGQTEGVDFAEGEFIAGWMALRYLNRPGDAAQHFKTLEDGVSTSISKSRAQYWLGEAYTAMGMTAEATAAYQRGAEHMTTFYGQRSAERLGITTVSLPAPVQPTSEEIAAFENKELVKVLRMLAEAGESYRFRVISYHLDGLLETPAEYQLLFDLAHSYNLTQAGVRGAKSGLGKDVVATEAAFPVFTFPMPTERRYSAEPALAIALARQESELNPGAISSARAYGLMQMLNSTAREQARREGMDYRMSWLLDDPEYNVKLGRAHLSDLIDRFDGSYILAIAGYNAGASRPARWITEYGDPRKGEIDPIDFIESIPFSETRNYVQRVLENTQVYRTRLTGEPAPLRLTEDLNR